MISIAIALPPDESTIAIEFVRIIYIILLYHLAYEVVRRTPCDVRCLFQSMTDRRG